MSTRTIAALYHSWNNWSIHLSYWEICAPRRIAGCWKITVALMVKRKASKASCPMDVPCNIFNSLCYKTRLSEITYHVLQSTLMVSPGL